MLHNAEQSVLENDCYQFDVIVSQEDENTFMFYEVYKDEAALEAHRNAPHYKKWRATVEDWFDGELERVMMNTVFPSDEGWVKQKPHLLDW